MINKLRILLFAFASVAAMCGAAEPIDIRSRLELFVDDYLIDTMKGARLALHEPVSREVVIQHDVPWEGSVSTGHTVFQDGPLYRMYYRGAHYSPGKDTTKFGLKNFPHGFLCYAESDDGIHWRRPVLGLVEFDDSTKNNII